MPTSDISDLCQQLWTEHSKQVTCHITKSSINQFQQTFEGAIFHCEDKLIPAHLLPMPLYYQSIEQTFHKILPSSNKYHKIQLPSFHHLLRPSKNNTESPITGQLVTVDNYLRATSWQNERKTFGVADPSSPLWTPRFVPCLTSLLDSSSSWSQWHAQTTLCQGMSTHFCQFSSRRLSTPISSCQDLAGFFTSIDQDRFVGAWIHAPGLPSTPYGCIRQWSIFSLSRKTNNPDDIIKGRTFRRLNVTRKIIIKDVPDLIRSALKMQTLALGQNCIRQCRGSPMGSPLSPALCLMAVSISEQIWSVNFKHILSNHNLFIRHIRYVDNRLIFGDSRLTDCSPYEVLLDDGFHGKPIILETEPDQEFLGFMLETKPLELIYQGPTNVSQVPLLFQHLHPKYSGFRSRCHIAVKGAFPEFRVRKGLDQLIHLYTLAGFPKEELHNISTQILTQHQNLQTHEQKFAEFFVDYSPFPSCFMKVLCFLHCWLGHWISRVLLLFLLS